MSLNHYVPNLIVKNFADDTNTLWVIDKRNGSCFPIKSRRARYDKAFAEHGYHSSDVEEVLAKIESKATFVVKKIIDSARSDGYSILGGTEKGYLCTFLFVQSLRIPRVKNWVMNTQWEFEGDKELLWQMFKDLSEDKYLVDLEAEKSNAEITGHTHLEKIIWLRMMDMNMSVGTLKADVCAALLIGDAPCLMNGFLANQGDLLSMPLAKDVYIELWRPEDSSGGRYELSNNDVQDLNIQTYSIASRFVAGDSKDLLIQTRDRVEQLDTSSTRFRQE